MLANSLPFDLLRPIKIFFFLFSQFMHTAVNLHNDNHNVFRDIKQIFKYICKHIYFSKSFYKRNQIPDCTFSTVKLF
jgi:hypothetical protein